MKAIWHTLVAVVLATAPVIAYSAHRAAIAEQQRLEQTLPQTRSQVQHLIDLRAESPVLNRSSLDETSLIAAVRAGLRAASVPDASVRDISTRRLVARDLTLQPAHSVDLTLNPCSPRLLGLVISALVSDASESETAIFTLRSVSMTQPQGSHAGDSDFQVTITLSPSISKENIPS